MPQKTDSSRKSELSLTVLRIPLPVMPSSSAYEDERQPNALLEASGPIAVEMDDTDTDPDSLSDETEAFESGESSRPKVPTLKAAAERTYQSFESSRVQAARAHSSQDVAKFWKRYKKNPKKHANDREVLILHYLHLVRYVVSRLPMTLPSSIAPEDLISYGTIGLMESIERFDPDRGLKFETYAVTRIRGSIIDHLRIQDWVPRGVRKRSKLLQETFVRMEEALGRTPTEEELAEELKLPKAKIQTMLAESSNLVLSLDDFLGNDGDGSSMSLMDTVEDKNSPNPEGELENVEAQRRLADAIGSLPEREKLLIALYYHENMTLKEIGEIINVSESRVCQLHAQAISRLRHRMGQG
jgi:RNA polymerase sigma factor FliA